MKNVLIISSTPRKGGNSDVLCDEFAKGAKESGNKVTKIRIADKGIGGVRSQWRGPSGGGVGEVMIGRDAV
jgi:multimeric flavodoxin WrbA